MTDNVKLIMKAINSLSGAERLCILRSLREEEDKRQDENNARVEKLARERAIKERQGAWWNSSH